MRNFQDTFETRKRSFVSAFSICMTVNLCFGPNALKLLQSREDLVRDAFLCGKSYVKMRLKYMISPK